jgi:2-hydroxy-3-keto-5-methylthiopentenyl-1-phosphate phosphatase
MVSMGTGRERTIYIGDGRSDLCPSRKVDCRFAKGVLAANLDREGVDFIAYTSLRDVAEMLAAGWRTEITFRD